MGKLSWQPELSDVFKPHYSFIVTLSWLESTDP